MIINRHWQRSIKMRNQLVAEIIKLNKQRDDIIFLTADLGFNFFEPLQQELGPRFINVGVCEQNMLSLAAGLAAEGYTPFCYTMASFLSLKGAEQIKVDICLHNLNVKLIGNNGGYGYGVNGPTHLALEDIAIISSFENMHCYIPYCKEVLARSFSEMMERMGPSYMRLNRGESFSQVVMTEPYAAIQQLQQGEQITVISCGSIALNVLKAIQRLESGVASFFMINELPLSDIEVLIEDIRKTKRLLIVEEHQEHGGVGAQIAHLLLVHGAEGYSFKHLYATGYLNGRVGSEDYYRQCSNLDINSIYQVLQEMI